MRLSGPTLDHSFWTRFVFIMAALSILTQLFQSAMDLDFINPEVEAQMDEEQMEEEEEITIRGAIGGGRRQWSYLSVGKDLIISIHPKVYLTLYCLNTFELQKQLSFSYEFFVCLFRVISPTSTLINTT